MRQLDFLVYCRSTLRLSKHPRPRSKGIVFFAEEVLKKADIKPIILGPKEGLGLINETVPSAALVSLVMRKLFIYIELSNVHSFEVTIQRS